MASTDGSRRRPRLDDLGANVKILGSIAVAGLVALLVGVVGLTALGSTNHATQQLYTENFTGLDEAAKLRRLTVQMRLDAVNHAISPDQATMDSYRSKIDESVASIQEGVDGYAASHDLSADQQAGVDEYREGLAAYLDVLRNEMLPASEANDIPRFTQLRDEKARPQADKMMAALDVLVQGEQESGAEAVQSAQESFDSSRTTVVAMLVVGIAAALGLGFVVARGIVSRLRKVQAQSEALAGGDLTHVSGVASRDEVGRVGQALDQAVDGLRTLVTSIHSSSQALSAAAEEMSVTSQQIASSADDSARQADRVSAAAEQVTRNVQTVATGSEEMGASIREIAHNANEAARVAAQAVGVAESTNGTVAKLGESSVEIGNVVKVITS
ncbi:methyl-accepting chemotaxis protein, partial [Vallicoccus soli]